MQIVESGSFVDSRSNPKNISKMTIKKQQNCFKKLELKIIIIKKNDRKS